MEQVTQLGQAIELITNQAIKKLEICLPCVVVKVRGSRVDVQPQIQAKTTAGEKISRPIVFNVPIFTIAAAGFRISMPVKAGDTGYIFGCDRDTSLFYQAQGGQDIPNTGRTHSFSDGFFVPIQFFNYSVTDAVEITNDSTFIKLENGKIEINTDNIKITAQEIEVTAPMTKINGSLTVNGNIESTGSISNSAVDLETHIHGNVQNGPNKTSGAIAP